MATQSEKWPTEQANEALRENLVQKAPKLALFKPGVESTTPHTILAVSQWLAQMFKAKAEQLFQVL